MKTNSKIILILIFLLSFSCKSEKKQDTSCVIINSEFTEQDHIKLSEFVESIEIIPLETSQDYLINIVGKIIKHKDLFYVGSANSLIDKVFVFDKNGKFVYKLDKRGVGPNEYIEIRDFDVIDNSKIVVISRSNPGIYVYDIQKDTCILHNNIDIYPNNIIAKDNHFYIMNDGTTYHRITNDIVFKYDEQGEYIESFFNIDQTTMNIISNVLPLKSLSSFKNDIYINYPFCNIIYKINDKQITNKYELNFGRKNLPLDKLNNAKDINEIDTYIKKNEGVNSLVYYAICSPFSLFTFYDYQLNGYILLYNENSNKPLIAHQIIDDLYFKGNRIKLKPWELPILLNDNTIYYHMEPNKLISLLQEYKNKLNSDKWQIFIKNHSQLIDKISKMKEDDNPVLLAIKLKQ